MSQSYPSKPDTAGEEDVPTTPHHIRDRHKRNRNLPWTWTSDSESEDDESSEDDARKPANLESVLTYQEEVPVDCERFYSDRLDHAFVPCSMFMLAFGRYPFRLQVHEDKTREVQFCWGSPRGWFFLFTHGVFVVNAMLLVIGLFSMITDIPGQPENGIRVNWTGDFKWGYSEAKGDLKSHNELRIEELFLLQRNFLPMIIILLATIHICTGDMSLLFRRDFIEKYFTTWDECVEIMKIDAAKHPVNVRKYMFQVCLFYFLYLLIIAALCGIKIAPIVTGAPTFLSILWLRIVITDIHAKTYLYILRVGGYVVFAYILICSKLYVLLILFESKVLANAFGTWNNRLDLVLRKGKRQEKKKSREEQCRTRTGFDHLFRDHVMLLDLLRGADTLFTSTIESYFATQVFSLCFEVYYFGRTLSAHDEFKGCRKMDGIIMGLYLIHSLIFLLLTTYAAAHVGEVAMDGLEIIRRNGCIGRKSNDEMYFIMSLYMSFTGYFETALTGGQFVVFDSKFAVGLVGSILSYFIILTQFTPPLALTDQAKLEVINTSALIFHTEATLSISKWCEGGN